jgi:hypothetical protein
MIYPEPIAAFGNIWLIVFFVNMFIVAFDFSSTKFFVLILVVVIIVILLVFLVPGMFTSLPEGTFNPRLTAEFYGIVTLIMAERLPTKSLRILKEIPDVFEFFILRAGSITLMPGHGDVIPLRTVLNINKKQKQIDYLLSHISIEPDELDA